MNGIFQTSNCMYPYSNVNIGGGLFALGSGRSSKGSRHSASPASTAGGCGIHSAPGASIASMCTSVRGGKLAAAGFNYPGIFASQ